MFKKFKKESGLASPKSRLGGTEAGQVSKLLLVLAIIVFVAVIIAYLVMRMATPPPKPPVTGEPVIPQPIYETTLGDVKFVWESSIDKGNTLWVSEARKDSYAQKNLVTTERYIKVTIGAQNKGKVNIAERSWDIGNIIDSEGRNFVPIEDYSVNPWLSNPNLCGALLKPEFNPTPCTKIYEVSRKSTGLKIEVMTGQENSANNFSAGKLDKALIDLIITQ